MKPSPPTSGPASSFPAPEWRMYRRTRGPPPLPPSPRLRKSETTDRRKGAMMAEERSTHLTIALPRFDGPFDLLLALIRRNQWSIDDLPVVEITGQFLAYIKQARDLDPELAGEFVETASWLVLLKSRSLLPTEDAQGPTPREELRRAVLDHATLAATTEFLRERYEGHRHPAGPGIGRGRQSQVLPPGPED